MGRPPRRWSDELMKVEGSSIVVEILGGSL
jgi:hypothetical protein